MKRLAAILLPVAISGCVSASPESAAVVVTGNTDQVRGCQLIEQISASQIWVGGGVGEADVIRQMRNQASARGATHLLTLQMSDTHYAQTSRGRGELYRCP